MTIKAASAKKAFLSLERLANTERGLSPYAFRQLYLACVASIANYESILWWKGQVGLASKLRSLQNLGLRRILGAFKTSPITSMEIEASLPPIEVRLNLEVRQYAFRLAKLSANHPVNLLKATTSDQDNPNSPNRLDWPKRPKPSTIQRIRQSIQGLVSSNALEPLIHFYYPS